MKTSLIEQPVIVDVFSPTAVVVSGRWVDQAGNQLAVAGANAHALAADDFSAADVAQATGIPAQKLTGIRLGFGEVELGGTVGDNVFGATDNVGRTVAATAGQARLCFVPKGGTVGARVRVLVLTVLFDNREPSAGITDLAAATGAASDTIADVGAAFNQTTLNNNFKSLATKLNAVIAALEAQKITTVV